MSLAFCSLKPGQSPPTSIYLICCRSLLPPCINDHSVMAAAGSTSAAQLALPTIPTVCIAPTDPSQAGLLLSPASEVIPKKLVDKIQSGRFIEILFRLYVCGLYNGCIYVCCVVGRPGQVSTLSHVGGVAPALLPNPLFHPNGWKPGFIAPVGSQPGAC